MKFGLRYANTGPFADGPAAVEIAQAAEQAGFDSIWTVEHTVVPANYESTYPYAPSGKMADGNDSVPIPDPLIWMAFVASATTTIKVGTAVMILPQHNPVITAKQVATLDHLAGGDRVILGIGVGWLEEEFQALGASFGDRGRRTDEYIEAMRVLWSQDKPNFDGEFVQLKDAFCRPQPPSKRIPIHIGGDTKPAARRAGRLGDGYFPARGNPTEMFDVMRAAAEEAGRDPAEIELTVAAPPTPAEIEALEKQGIDRVAVPLTTMAGLETQVTNPDEVLAYGKNIIANLS